MDIKILFARKFKQIPDFLFWSPGRVNIIGEHSDYHDGLVMPAAIDLGMMWAVKKRADNKVRVYSQKFNEIGEFFTTETQRTKCEWLLYMQGVVEVLKKRKIKVTGVDIVLLSTIPIGSGLSSSSSIATGFTFIINSIFNLGLNKKEIAQIACEAEWWYGTTGGIMDQYCISNGKAGYAILLDCRTVTHQLIKIPESIEIVVFETTVRHKQLDSPFDLRKKQANEIIKIAQNEYSDKKISKLRDLNEKMLLSIKNKVIQKFGNIGEVYFKRALHPVTENERVRDMKNALSGCSFELIGSLLSQSHQSLRNNYQVSCRELDVAVDISHVFDGLIGSRMVGGGFGGCTINLVKKGGSQRFAKFMEREFKKITNIQGNAYICSTSDGVQKII